MHRSLRALDALGRRIRRGERLMPDKTTAEAAVSACLARIAEREPAVGAWTYLDPERALAEARTRDALAPNGPLHSVVVGIKDIMDTGDMPTEYGSAIYHGHRPAADAACVSVLRKAGAVALGKTVTTEFAAFHPGKTRNPHNPEHTPGGSSSGSAAAVADGMVPVALGTQTMGSVIRPASFCGVVGYKPSFGLINRTGVKSQAEAVDTIGVFARSVADAARVAAVLMGAAPMDFATTVAHPPRIALYRGPDWGKAEPAAANAFEEAAQRLALAGASVAEIAPPAVLDEAAVAHVPIVMYELARAFAPEWLAHRELLSAALVGMIDDGWALPFADYAAALEAMEAGRRWIAGRFLVADLLLTLSAPGEAPKGLASTGDSVFNRLWSGLHLPALTLPYGRGPNGLPLGIQLIGKFRGDAQFVAAARWVEEVLR
jgi:Asp-tRNA(Asn)/Glu-tRNA(Gln) amidotransferase A subunit family amidase